MEQNIRVLDRKFTPCTKGDTIADMGRHIGQGRQRSETNGV